MVGLSYEGKQRPLRHPSFFFGNGEWVGEKRKRRGGVEVTGRREKDTEGKEWNERYIYIYMYIPCVADNL